MRTKVPSRHDLRGLTESKEHGGEKKKKRPGGRQRGERESNEERSGKKEGSGWNRTRMELS